MRLRALAPFLCLCLFSTASASTTDPLALAARAISEDAPVAAAATSELRALGPAGLEALLSAHADAIQLHKEGSLPATDPAWRRISTAVDRVARQRDAWASGLYWHTDLEQAKAAARASGKPILSLRLLGNLDDDLSCANSRFFRTLLYSNETIARTMRSAFVLHWQSVRPVPRVTIDFGDGRRLERTITGNSIHYALDAEGRILDALPGLYDAGAFARWLSEIRAVAEQASRVDAKDRWPALRAYHKGRMHRARRTWARDLERAGIKAPAPATARDTSASPPHALIAGAAAYTKAVIELPVLRAMYPEAKPLADATDDAAWRTIAALHRASVRFDADTRALLRDYVEPAALERTLANLADAIALDATRNEYLLHAEIHEWLAASSEPPTLDSLNERVYAELFLTPSSDPWLGLNPEGTFTGLGAR